MPQALYEPLIERDLDAIPEAVREFRSQHSSDELFLALARFAILAYAPSLHGKHSVIAALSAHEARDRFGDQWDELLIEVARYAAETRQPWSEPPILEPPSIGLNQPADISALRDAMAGRNRHAAERWLAARVGDAEEDLLTVAADSFEDGGMTFLLVDAVIKLSRILGEKGKYAALRVAAWDLVSGIPRPWRRSRSLSTAAARPPHSGLVKNAIAEKGSIESVHAVLLYHAAEGNDRVFDYLSSLELKSTNEELPRATGRPIYRLARDYGQHLRAFAIGDEQLQSATKYNLDHGESVADWSFA